MYLTEDQSNKLKIPSDFIFLYEDNYIKTQVLNDLKTFGFIFETLCIRDLRVYAEPLHGTIFHFRTKEGLECDAVIHLRDGRYGLVEIKLGGDKLIEEGAKTLKSMEAKIDTEKMNVPSFLATRCVK